MSSVVRIAVSAAMFFLTPGHAIAGDTYRGLKDARGCAQGFRGFYGGSHAGLGHQTSRQHDLDGYFANTSGYVASDRGVLAGPQIGYNHRAGCHALLGIELDWSGANLDATTRLNPNAAPAGSDQSLSSRLRNFGTIRLRSGLVIESTLLYVTGGLAIAKIDTRITSSIPGIRDEQFSFSDTRVGWTAGAGTEWALGPTVSIKAEVLYMAFGEKSRTFDSPAAAGAFSFGADDSAWVSRVGLNIRLGN